ncbi:MAG: methylase involved in ubiquinone/menaquinone biosynthesis, partial [Anaerocolumna sp.]|nr:methylase involved in ubiquinone/menaquinone biosynthesis [Anaerocolumna sp.]
MEKNIKDEIKTYYGGIAKKVSENSKASCGCKASCCGNTSNESVLYSKEFTEGLPVEAINAS